MITKKLTALMLCAAIGLTSLAGCNTTSSGTDTDTDTQMPDTTAVPETEAVDNTPIEYSEMTFGANGNGTFFTGASYGVYTVNDILGTLDITYADTTNLGDHYISKIKFSTSRDISPEMKFVRVLYSASCPNAKQNITMYLYNDKTSDTAYFEASVKDTKGEYVLSRTAELSDDTMARFSATGDYSSPSHNSLAITDIAEDSVYSIKALYFFTSREDADRFTYEPTYIPVTVNGVDITKYTIVTADDPSVHVTEAASVLIARVAELTGVVLPLVTDETAPSEYEILIGKSNREITETALSEAQKVNYDENRYFARLDGTTLVITSELPYNLKTAVNKVIDYYMDDDDAESGDPVNIPENIKINNTTDYIQPYDGWLGVVRNVADPERFTDGFDSDDGYWTEESAADDWSIADGVMSADSDDFALSYLHVYEKNVEYTTKLCYTEAAEDSDMGLMLRYTAEDAYVKAGYDFETGEWYIDYREGIDFYKYRAASAKAELTPDTWYTLTFKVDGKDASLSVDGVELLSAKITQTTPGRIGVYADGASVSVDDADILLLSGQGKIMQNVVHTKFPESTYIEGGTVLVMDDGSLIYQHHKGAAYKSLDNGVTWEKTDMWTTTTGYTNILRLNDGTWLKMTSGNRSGTRYIYSQTSNDNGKTWIDGGNVCYAKYQNNTPAGAGNMNDKLMQSGTTDRIFYCQNYETQTTAVDGRMVFCEFYYSDDNGATWTKSETDSWELGGNETQTHFGECKILECADGTLRMYNSWNRYGNIMYSESTDNGVTWGPLTKLEGFITPQSSMQFVRDPYAENDTTYYMVWVYGPIHYANKGMARSRLCLARSTDGKNWDYLGDIWRWENNYFAPNTKALITHIVDPFIQVTEDHIICGSGFSEQLAIEKAGDNSYHQAQRQHVYSIKKDTLTVSALPPVK